MFFFEFTSPRKKIQNDFFYLQHSSNLQVCISRNGKENDINNNNNITENPIEKCNRIYVGGEDLEIQSFR